jgi:hypothetical protein
MSSPQVTTDAGPQQPDREVMVLGKDWRESYIDFIRIKGYRRGWTQGAQRQHVSCAEVRGSS